jgi:hypothetical protein
LPDMFGYPTYTFKLTRWDEKAGLRGMH